MNGISDENVFVLQLDEFVCLLCQIGCQLCRGGTPKEIARHIGERLNLYDPKAVRDRLAYLGRHDAGFGAWKCEEKTVVKVCCLFSSCVRQVSCVSAKKKKPVVERQRFFFCECEGKAVVKVCCLFSSFVRQVSFVSVKKKICG